MEKARQDWVVNCSMAKQIFQPNEELPRDYGTMRRVDCPSGICEYRTNSAKQRAHMQNNNAKKWMPVFSLLVANLLATASIIVYLVVPVGKQIGIHSKLAFDCIENGQYVLYIGTNSKDTYEQIISTEDAREIVNAIVVKYLDGYTVHVAMGGWVDEKGILTQENTLVYTLIGADETAIISILDEVLTALDQNSILVERRDISRVFYSGKGY